MAQAPVQTVREVLPEVGGAPSMSARASVDYPNLGPEAFGAASASGLINAGAGVLRLAAFYNDAAADDATNKYQAAITKMMYGDPSKTNPDGSPDVGYMGLRGKAAIDAAPKMGEDMDRLYKQLDGDLNAPAAKKKFSDYSRRFRAITDAQVGQHRTGQYKSWMGGVYTASEKLAMDGISANADNEQGFLDHTAELTRARVRKAQVLYGDDPTIINEAVASAKRDALEGRLNIIGAKDPARALRMLDANKDTAGIKYDDLYNRFRAQADGQIGREYADQFVSGVLPPEASANAQSMLKHFEGFRTQAYWDVNAWRVGYGSDTVTKADGTVVPVTQDTVVTQEDAERDLVRRTQLSANDARKAVGAEAWDKLDEKARTSLTSIAYNYGGANFPKSVAEAARTGDAKKLTEAIIGLSGHNNGVNKRRRLQEAGNIDGNMRMEELGSQDPADIMDRINNSGMNDAQKAAATARVSQQLAQSRAQQARTKAAFESRVKDSVAQAEVTGGTNMPVSEADFIKQYGRETGEVKYQEYNDNLQAGADKHSFQSMSDLEIQRTIDGRMPQPLSDGTYAPGYAHKIQNIDRARKQAADIVKQRRQDPAGAVAKSAAVQEAMNQYDKQNPRSFQKVAEARLAAQEALGIEADYRSPITEAEALQMTRPLKTMLPGEEKETFVKVGRQFQEMFGDYAQDAFGYALRANKTDVETAKEAASIAKKIWSGQPVSRLDARASDEAKISDAEKQAVFGTQSTPPATGQFFGPEGFGEGAPGAPAEVAGPPAPKKPVVPPAAVKYLLANPGAASEFDKKYGTGRSKEILEKFGSASVP